MSGPKLLATGCDDNNAYTWDVAAIVREAGLDDLLSDPKLNDATRRSVPQRRPAHHLPQGFFDVPSDRSHSSARSPPHSLSAPQGSTLFARLLS
ncbi:hypothetical protein CY34DRAFT_813629 [Suillus luteus UH-Slu-Lm8-n1]|uniref:Uncharacterized protein n=1 Tax=Suillus luteus UH-Slu-Lm8-n1 TaxID=930992 RepID=A0A0C9Z799_9AGAM|nr:hypothetical protein CY34DRAFT_813629 [Suillus luteus UH-Slu-Lm8-n1]